MSSRNADRHVGGGSKAEIRLLVCGLMTAGWLASASAPATEWVWQNPLPQGNDLTDVLFLDSNTAVAIGWGGVIMRTTDGGQTWSPVDMSSVIDDPSRTYYFYHLSQVEADILWAVGNFGASVNGSYAVIIKSTDGGLTWNANYTSGPGSLLLDIHFMDASHGIAVGFDTPNSADTFRTTDGGDTWIPSYSGESGLPWQVCFPTGTIGYMVNIVGEILKTTDGGDSWVIQDSGTTNWLKSCFFTDADTGTVVGSGGTILKTVDGGDTWIHQVSPVPDDLFGIYFTNANNGWITTNGSSSPEGSILQTSDGGANWTVQYTVASQSGGLDGVWFADADTGIAVGDNGMILRTTDGGSNWTEVSSSVTLATLSSVSTVDENTTVAAGGFGVVIKTTDGGGNWVLMTNTGLYNHGVAFVDADTGWVVGSPGAGGSILKTVDGGNTWTQQYHDNGKLLQAVWFLNENMGWVVGTNGSVLRTTDGGATWIEETAGTSRMLVSVTFLDANIGWATGRPINSSDGEILKTTDGGESWVSQGTFATPITDISFVDSNTGWAVGGNTSGGNHDGILLTTTDGGASWTEQSYGATTALYGVRFTDAQHGMAVGAGLVISTTDGGDTWVRENILVHKHLNAISRNGTGSVTIVGNGGTVIRMEPSSEAPQVQVSPPALAFEVPLGGEDDATIQIANIGAGDLVWGIDVELLPGDGCAQTPWLNISPDAGSTPAGDSTPVDVLVDTTGLEVCDYAARLHVATNDPDHPSVVVPVSLTVTGSELMFDPESVDFGEVEAGHTSPPAIVTLHSVGALDATGLEFQLPGDDFAVDASACGTTLPIGGECDVVVTFTPPGVGPSNGALQVHSDDGAVATVSLSGQGVPETEIFASMGLEVDFEPIISDANGVFEPGELVPVAPMWHNGGQFAQVLEGTASNFTGPEGPTYSLLAADADYGLVETGQTASCRASGICYEMDIGPAGLERPALHWDASFDEALSDETIKTWTLHVGDSFADVPREGLFYPWIETLLHYRVTGGCADAAYCPAAANTRGQMAVFLLKASEGGDYLPPACVEGEEVFADVPFDNLFCPWIEELAGRGVTAGCGGGNYCPNASVNRDQMAVFLLKTLEGPGYTPPACTGVFADVPCPSLFANWIEDLVARGITAGCGGGNYCPSNPVSRDQMAVFLGKTFGLTLYGP